MTILGLHHITLVTAHAQRNVAFYTKTLGLRLIKQTVNFDDPGSYHLYFGDAQATPGTAITFFAWPQAPQGIPGIGGTHHVALTVPDRDGLLMWKRRLEDLGVAVDGPFERYYFTSIYFQDPDGVIIELATAGPGMAVDEALAVLGTGFCAPPEALLAHNRDAAAVRALTWPESVPMITPAMELRHGMHHITAISSNIERTHAFFGDLLGMRRVKMTSNFDDPTSAHWYWGDETGRPGTLLTYFERDRQRHTRVRMGTGQTHHFALAVADDASQLAWRERLLAAGLRVSPVMDRVYFKSIYTHDPDGHIVELATLGPGFTADEPLEQLGQRLQLPPWLEEQRASIERVLGGLNV
ncbi:MAG: glyoxalase [Candidatus Viridilinea halotolerans]|uniref:Glyoxalase n=1 Tax=Candidatus Viridilinea halotolerans TaxID=2491704 RepID=A0A426TRK3_9CHLR|nr:MAG: glyoxalase [Candidatus Viridilinea halotolerans]